MTRTMPGPSVYPIDLPSNSLNIGLVTPITTWIPNLISITKVNAEYGLKVNGVD